MPLVSKDPQELQVQQELKELKGSRSLQDPKDPQVLTDVMLELDPPAQ